MASSTAHEQFGSSDRTSDASLSRLAAALGCARRRAVLSVLAERDGRMNVDALVAATWARETGADVDELDEAERERVRASLYHVHLPKLESLGAVTIDHGRDVVEPNAHPVFEREAIRSLLEDHDALRRETVDTVMSIVSHQRKRAIVSVLAAADAPLTSASIARRVARVGTDGNEGALDDAAAEVYRTLHHVHLPQLDQWDVVDYAPERGTAQFLGDGSALAPTTDADAVTDGDWFALARSSASADD